MVAELARLGGYANKCRAYFGASAFALAVASQPSLAQNAADGGVDLQDLPVEAAETVDCEGRWITPGLIETHIHLDKSRILDRCTPAPERGTDHMRRVAAVKLPPREIAESKFDVDSVNAELMSVAGL